MANFGPLTAEIGLGVWGTPANFNGFRVLPSLLHRDVAHRWPTKHCTMFGPSHGLVHYIYIFGGSCPLTEFCPVQYSLYSVRPSLAFSRTGSVTARQSSSGRQPKFAGWYKEWNYATVAEGAIYIRPGGHHVGHRPTL